MALWYNTGRHWQQISFARDNSNLKGILVCSGPSLNKINKSELPGIGKRIFGLNNTYPDVKPDVWIGMDRSFCYDGKLFDEPFVKILRRGYGKEKRGTRKINTLTNLYYADVKEGDRINLFKHRNHDTKFVWHKNTMATALHIMVWMGHREIYLAGCDLDNSQQPYFNKLKLSKSQRQRNQKLHNQLFGYLEWFISAAKPYGIELYSMSPRSRINTLMEYVSLRDLNREIKRGLRKRGPRDHSSLVQKQHLAKKQRIENEKA